MPSEQKLTVSKRRLPHRTSRLLRRLPCRSNRSGSNSSSSSYSSLYFLHLISPFGRSVYRTHACKPYIYSRCTTSLGSSCFTSSLGTRHLYCNYKSKPKRHSLQRIHVCRVREQSKHLASPFLWHHHAQRTIDQDQDRTMIAAASLFGLSSCLVGAFPCVACLPPGSAPGVINVALLDDPSYLAYDSWCYNHPHYTTSSGSRSSSLRLRR